ncbi:MAG: tetratricopeptide repeat protein [Candidatus Heimdallarchaeota archaeon]
MVEDEEIQQFVGRVNSQHYSKSLKMIETLVNNLDKNAVRARLSLKLLKAYVFLIPAKYNDSLLLADQILDETSELETPLMIIDVLLIKIRALWRLGKYVEGFENLARVEGILGTVKGISISSLHQRLAWVSFLKSVILVRKGELKKALSCGEESLTMFKNINYEPGIAETLDNKGFVYYFRGEFEKSLRYYNESLALNTKLNNKMGMAATLSRIAMIFGNIGDPEKEEDYLKRSLALAQEIGFQKGIAEVYGAFGRMASNKGELDYALENYSKSLSIYDSIGRMGSIGRAWFLGRIGKVFHQKGNLGEAEEYYKKSLQIYADLQSTNEAMYDAFVSYVKLCIELNKLEEINPFLQNIKQVDKSEKTIASVSGTFSLIQGLLLRDSLRIKDKARAQDLFKQVVLEKDMYHEFKVEALLNLCDLLIEELKISGSEEVLNEIEHFSSQLYDIAKVHSSYYLLAETYLLESKLALLNLDPKQSFEYLDRSERLAEEKGFLELRRKIVSERGRLVKIIDKWDRLIDETPSPKDIIELTQLDSLLDRMLLKKVKRNEEEILEYAHYAKQLVETLEEEKKSI